MKLTNVIICEDIRKEETGKYTLVGVYLDNIMLKHFPALINITAWVQFTVRSEGDLEIELRLLIDKKPLASTGGVISVTDPTKSNTISLPQFHVRVEEPALIMFQIREKGKKWRTLRNLPVSHLPDA